MPCTEPLACANWPRFPMGEFARQYAPTRIVHSAKFLTNPIQPAMMPWITAGLHSRHLLAAVAALAIAALPAYSRTGDGVRITTNDTRQLVMTVVPNIDTTRLPSGELFISVASGATLNPDQPGAPMQQGIIIPLALPSPEGNTLEVVAAEYGPPISARIAPVPSMITDPQGFSVPRYDADPAAYSVAAPAAAPATLRYVGIARNYHAGQIVVAPYRFDGPSGTVRFLKSATLRVRYNAAAAAGSGRGVGVRDQQFGAGLFVNPSAAAAWAKPVAVPQTFARRTAASTARAWMRVEVKEDGLYELRAEDFKNGGIDLSTVDPSRIAIYGGDGGPMPEDISAADSNRMRQIPARVETSGGKATRVLFYGVGPTRWQYQPSDSIPTHQLSVYVKSNSYIVAVDGDPARDFPQQPTLADPTTFPTAGRARFVHDEDLYNAIAINNAGAGSGKGWFGTQFIVGDPSIADSRTFVNTLAGLDRSQPVFYRVRVGNAVRGGSGEFSVAEGNTQLGTLLVNGPSDCKYCGDQMMNATTRLFTTNGSAIPSDNQSAIRIGFEANRQGSGYLDYFEVHYGRSLVAINDEISFESPTGTGVAGYTIRGFAAGDLVGLDITDPVNPEELHRPSASGDYSFRGPLSLLRNGARRYFVGSASKAKKVAAAVPADFGDLRNRPLNADVLVITHKDFKTVAQQYADYRTSTGRNRAAVVTTDEIYTEYSNGNLDPTAIRDYIAQAVKSWTRPPLYVVLFGDGTFDYRNISSRQKQLVPTMETEDGDSYDRIYSSAFDDYYVRVVGQDDFPDLLVGRFPIEASEQAEVIVEKIKQYESSKNFGAWRHTIVLVSDDNLPTGEGGGFLSQSEKLVRDFIPNWADNKKIYLGAYPTEVTGTATKPAAAQDLLTYLNRGAVVVNWVGHGNPNVWGHESVLQKDALIPKLTNDSMLTFVSAVTCNFGRFDDPANPSGGEQFLLHEGGGAIGVLATTRGVFINDNEDLMREYFSKLFARDSATLQFLNVGQAMLAAKTRRFASFSNDQKYILFGDPTMYLNLPKDSVEIVTVNDQLVANDTAQIGALQLVTVKGVIRNRDGKMREDFNGTAIITLYDANRTQVVVSDNISEPMVVQGGQLFRGPTPVVNGAFTIQFRVPKDIAYDSALARLHGYAYNDVEDAVGGTNHVMVYGSDTATVVDTEGPKIKIFLDDRTFASGDVVTPTPMLIVDLRDGSGINSSGAGIGHRIEAWINGSPNSIDLTDLYTTSPTDYREGTAERELLSLEQGEHTVRVRGWDIFNNSAEATATFKIVGTGENPTLQLAEIANYPNPISRETDFTFRHNQVVPLDVEIAIFTPGGRKVRTLEATAVQQRRVKLHWDGRDADGDPLANGVYYYRVRATKTSGEGAASETFETIEKLVVAR